MGKLIGVFATDVSSRVQGQLYQKLHDHFKTKGYNLVFFSAELERANYNTTDQSALKLFEMADRLDFSAFIIHVQSILNREYVNTIIRMGKQRDIPVFLYDCDLYGYSSKDDVFVINLNYKQGFEDNVKHLIEYHGCRNIYMMAGTEGNFFSEERVEAFQKVMKEHGLICSDDRIVHGGFWEVPAIEAMKKLLDSIEKRKLPFPEAICCANDSMAIAVVKVLSKRGYRVPEDIKITGFDGIEDGKFSCPAISTCEPILEEVPKFILNAIEHGEKSGEFLVPLRFIPKESCGCDNVYESHDKQEMAKVMENARQNIWQHSMLANLQTKQLDACDIPGLFEGMRATLQQFKGLELIYCVRDDLEVVNSYASDFERLRVRLNQGIYAKDSTEDFSVEEVIPACEQIICNAEADDLFIFHLLQSETDRFGYSVAKAKQFVANEVRILSQFHESFAIMLEGVLRNIRLEQANRKLSEMYERMSDLYIRDVMTGLFNRSGYYTYLEEYLTKKELADDYLHIISVDMDGMKQINDAYGHQEGDLAIKAVAKALQDCFEPPCIAARFGGDEYMVSLFTKDENVPTLEQISERLNQYLQSIPMLAGKPYTVCVSVGHAVEKVSAITDLFALEKIADDSMYQTKRRHKSLLKQ